MNSPDQYFKKKLASIRSIDELDAFVAGIKNHRAPTQDETHAMAHRRIDIYRGQ